MLQAALPGRRQPLCHPHGRGLRRVRRLSMAACTAGNALVELRPYSGLRSAHRNHPRNVVVFDVGLDVVRVNSPYVVISAIGAALSLPLIDDALESRPCSPEVRRTRPLSTFPLPRERLRSILGVRPPPGVAIGGLPFPLRCPSGAGLRLPAHPVESAVLSGLLVEVGCWVLLLAGRAPDRGGGSNLGGWRATVALLLVGQGDS